MSDAYRDKLEQAIDVLAVRAIQDDAAHKTLALSLIDDVSEYIRHQGRGLPKAAEQMLVEATNATNTNEIPRIINRLLEALAIAERHQQSNSKRTTQSKRRTTP
ncbi:MAG: hypothetical protein K0U74_12105 [Alphaproteobacteria bacterium]|nr:hypothetical protein [Alphaproteobacteria bacterium]